MRVKEYEFKHSISLEAVGNTVELHANYNRSFGLELGVYLNDRLLVGVENLEYFFRGLGWSRLVWKRTNGPN